MPENYARFVQRFDNGTDGGSAIANTDHVRSLTYKDYDQDNIASLVAGNIRLSAGTYRIKYSAPALGVGRHYVWLENFSDGIEISRLSSNAQSNATNATQTRSELICEVVLDNQKDLRCRHWTELGRSINGLGMAVGRDKEVFAIVEVWKL